MPSFRPTTPYSKEVEPTPSEEHKARIQRTMGIPAYDYQKMAASRGASRSVDEDTLSDLYAMGTLLPATVPGAGGITVGQSKVAPTAASSAAPVDRDISGYFSTLVPNKKDDPKPIASTKAVKKQGAPAVMAAPSPASYGPNKSQRLLDSYLDQNIDSANVYDPTMSSLPIKNNSSQQLNSYLNKAMDSAATTKPSVAAPDMAKAAGELPKTKSGMKKFMDEYGKFIALGALAGAGGKKGMIAAPIMAALPGILKMLQNRGKKTADAPAAPVSNPSVQVGMAHGGSMGNKSAAHPKKKMAGGSIRKFSGGSMNTFKYRDGGKPKLPASTLIPDNILFNDTDAAKQMLGRLVYEQNRPSPMKSVKTSPKKYSPRDDSQYMSDIESMGMMRKDLEDAPDIPTGYSSDGRSYGIDESQIKAGPSSEVMNMPNRGNRGNRSIEDAIYSSAKDADYDIPAGSVPKSKSGLKKFFSMVGKGLGIKKKSRSNDEDSQSLYSGGTVRKFKGGSMNTLKENLVPKYKKGGNMPKGMPKEMMAMMGKMQKGNTLRRAPGGAFGIPQSTGTGPAMGIMGMGQPMQGKPMQTAVLPAAGGMGMDQQMTPMGSNMRPPAGPPAGMGKPMQPQMGAPDNYGLMKKMKMMGPMAAGVPSVAPPRRRAGGAIRKFEGGTMNSMDDNFTPSYKKGGAMSKGMMAMMGKKYKKGGEMSKHEDMAMDMALIKKMVPSAKKMDMAKPKASSMDQKFAKGGTARYASGGMCKGYGIAKKIRPTGSMN